MRDNKRQPLRCHYDPETQLKTIPKEFKDEAVALVLEQGYSVPEAAKSLGIAANMLYKWKVRPPILITAVGLHLHRRAKEFFLRVETVLVVEGWQKNYVKKALVSVANAPVS